MDEFQLGQVVYVFSRKAGKEKYHVVVCVDPKLIFFMVNTNIPPFHRKRPELAENHVKILRHEHPYFLHHDSYVYCGECLGIDDLPGTPESYGSISDNAIEGILEATKNSGTISKRNKRFILESFQ